MKGGMMKTLTVVELFKTVLGRSYTTGRLGDDHPYYIEPDGTTWTWDASIDRYVSNEV